MIAHISVVPKFAMGQFYNGIHEQIQHFAEFKQKNMFIYIYKRLCIYIYVFIRGSPRLDASGEHKLLVTKQRKNGQSSLGQTDYRLFINSDKGPLFEKKEIMALNGLHLFIHSHPTTQLNHALKNTLQY